MTWRNATITLRDMSAEIAPAPIAGVSVSRWMATRAAIFALAMLIAFVIALQLGDGQLARRIYALGLLAVVHAFVWQLIANIVRRR